MKFVRAAIALVLVAATASSGADAARMPKNNRREMKKTLDHRMKNGLFDKRTLMKGAEPHSAAAKKREELRKLGDMEITGSYSVQFQSCFSLTQSYADIFDADEDGGTSMMLMQSGNLQPLRSYAIFRLCYNSVCQANGNEAMLDYVVDLDTYVQALVNYLPEQMEEFCEGCLDNYDSCMSILYGGYASAYENGNQYNYRQDYNAGDNNYNGNNVNNVNYQYGSYGYGGSANGNGGYGNGGYNNGQQQQQAYNGGYSNAYSGDDQQQQQQAYNGGYSNAYSGDDQQQQQQANNGGYNNAYNGGYSNANNANNANNGYNRKARELHEFQKRVLENGQVVKQLDCNLCQEYNCLVENDDENGDLYGFEAASEWLQEMAECRETEISYSGGYSGGYGNYNNNNGDDNGMYTGFICNADGNGVELGLFLDEDCVLYLPNESYMNYMSYFDQTYAEMTKEIIEFTFSNAVLSCKDQETVYTTQDIGGYNMYNYQDYDWNGDGDDVSEWCETLVSGGESTPVDISSCGMYSDGYNNNYNQNYQQYYEQYQDQDEDMQYQYQYDWYRYEVSEDDSLDMYTVCNVIKTNGGAMHTFYNNNNGNLYDFGSANSASDTISEFLEGSDSEVNFVESSSMSARVQSLSGGAKFGIVAGTGIMVGAAVALYLRFKSSAVDSKNIALIDDEDDVVEQSRKNEVAYETEYSEQIM